MERYIDEWDVGSNPFFIHHGIPGEVFFKHLIDTKKKSTKILIIVDDQGRSISLP